MNDRITWQLANEHIRELRVESAARGGQRRRRGGEAVSKLVTAAAAGDERAWNALVAEFSGLLWAIARSHRLHDAQAADVVQSTWLRLVEHLGRLNDPSRVGAWLTTTARRECLRVLRDRQRAMPFGEEAPECPSEDLGPDELLLEHERDDALRRSFGRLRESDQALLRLLVADPRPPYEEIAEALGMPTGSIGPTRQRALERLRRELESDGSLALLIA
jgi:RNA polymerase sigma factor (sigma-70 family)